MVSFWPWKSDDKSAAAFEKVLSSLTVRINKVTAKDVGFRQSQRRLRVLWCLYAGASYIVAALILTLVTGWANWTVPEGAVVIGGPFLIYGVRLIINTYYDYRIAATQKHLANLNKQREETIAQLKDATKYNSTQELLQKYGGPSESPRPDAASKHNKSPRSPSTRQPARTGISPPATANIPNRTSRASLTTNDTTQSVSPEKQLPDLPSNATPTAEFAPNAFDDIPASRSSPRTTQVVQQQQQTHQNHSWMDRLLDLVMGEDETQPKNRIVLICAHCRLVNGQAPPGTRALEELGQWTCMGCRASNGVPGDETGRLIRQLADRGPAGAVDQQSGLQTTVDRKRPVGSDGDDRDGSDRGASVSSVEIDSDREGDAVADAQSTARQAVRSTRMRKKTGK